jgi:hypothetical protein
LAVKQNQHSFRKRLQSVKGFFEYLDYIRTYKALHTICILYKTFSVLNAEHKML